MHDSTVFRDLAQHLEREAQRFEQLEDYYWAGHLLADADQLLKRAERLAKREPPLPSVESLAGVDLGFKSAESERGVCSECGATIGSGDDGPDCAQDVIVRLRQREVSCRECGEPVERGEVVFHEECLDPAIIAARAALEQGEQS